jgi:hypothetical protein
MCMGAGAIASTTMAGAGRAGTGAVMRCVAGMAGAAPTAGMTGGMAVTSGASAAAISEEASEISEEISEGTETTPAGDAKAAGSSGAEWTVVSNADRSSGPALPPQVSALKARDGARPVLVQRLELRLRPRFADRARDAQAAGPQAVV